MEVILSDAKNAVDGDVLDKIPRHELMLTKAISNGSNCFTDVTDDTIRDTSDVVDDDASEAAAAPDTDCPMAVQRSRSVVNTSGATVQHLRSTPATAQVSVSQC